MPHDRCPVGAAEPLEAPWRVCRPPPAWHPRTASTRPPPGSPSTTPCRVVLHHPLPRDRRPRRWMAGSARPGRPVTPMPMRLCARATAVTPAVWAGAASGGPPVPGAAAVSPQAAGVGFPLRFNRLWAQLTLNLVPSGRWFEICHCCAPGAGRRNLQEKQFRVVRQKEPGPEKLGGVLNW